MESDAVILDVGGVGFRVYVPASVRAAAGPPGTEMALHTHLIVRENELSLYGAPDEPSMDLFRLLLEVSGVGPRVALAMLSTMPPSAITEAILAEDATTLTRAPGVGRKLAQRIVLELKGRVESLALAEGGTVVGQPTAGIDADAVAALVSLGYSAAEARRAVAAIDVANGASTEERVLAALRSLARA
jgi:Holliday junction DNA helicase RuvA